MRRWALSSAVGLSACGAELQPVIDPPPTRTVTFVSGPEDAGELEISVGSSTVVACVDSCSSGSCEHAEVRSENATVLSVRNVTPTGDGTLDAEQLFAITAHQARHTTLILESDCGNRRYDVTVTQ